MIFFWGKFVLKENLTFHDYTESKMAVVNHNALPMYQVNSDLFYEQVFILLPLFQISSHLSSAKPVCPGSHKGVSLQIQHLSGETVQSSKFFHVFFFLRLKSRMLTSPSLTLISIWTLRSRVFWLVWTVQMISLFIVLQMPDFVKIFPNYSTAKTAPAGGWMKWTVHCQLNCATIVQISLLRKLINNCRKACL